MPKFRKKPVVVEAFPWEPNDLAGAGRLAFWLGQNNADFIVNPDHTLTIHTLEGDMRADKGDWIIRGVKGEFYPCKPDIFEATYETVEA